MSQPLRENIHSLKDDTLSTKSFDHLHTATTPSVSSGINGTTPRGQVVGGRESGMSGASSAQDDGVAPPGKNLTPMTGAWSDVVVVPAVINLQGEGGQKKAASSNTASTVRADSEKNVNVGSPLTPIRMRRNDPYAVSPPPPSHHSDAASPVGLGQASFAAANHAGSGHFSNPHPAPLVEMSSFHSADMSEVNPSADTVMTRTNSTDESYFKKINNMMMNNLQSFVQSNASGSNIPPMLNPQLLKQPSSMNNQHYYNNFQNGQRQESFNVTGHVNSFPFNNMSQSNPMLVPNFSAIPNLANAPDSMLIAVASMLAQQNNIYTNTMNSFRGNPDQMLSNTHCGQVENTACNGRSAGMFNRLNGGVPSESNTHSISPTTQSVSNYGSDYNSNAPSCIPTTTLFPLPPPPTANRLQQWLEIETPPQSPMGNEQRADNSTAEKHKKCKMIKITMRWFRYIHGLLYPGESSFGEDGGRADTSEKETDNVYRKYLLAVQKDFYRDGKTEKDDDIPIDNAQRLFMCTCPEPPAELLGLAVRLAQFSETASLTPEDTSDSAVSISTLNLPAAFSTATLFSLYDAWIDRIESWWQRFYAYSIQQWYRDRCYYQSVLAIQQQQGTCGFPLMSFPTGHLPVLPEQFNLNYKPQQNQNVRSWNNKGQQFQQFPSNQVIHRQPRKNNTNNSTKGECNTTLNVMAKDYIPPATMSAPEVGASSRSAGRYRSENIFFISAPSDQNN